MIHDNPCERHNDTGHTTHTRGTNSGWEPWVASAIAIAVISFGSLIGILAFRGQKRRAFPYVLVFMVALGLSVLLGDAMLHLFPHSLGIHGHDHEEGHGEHGEEEEEHVPFESSSYVWKSLLFLIGIYVFLIFELIMYLCNGKHTHSHSHDIELPSRKSGPAVVISNTNSAISPGESSGHQSDEIRKKNVPKKRLQIKEIQSVAWMILIGDGVHNFMDGVAIGAAFSEPFPYGLRGGIMTSIAIMIHELPHELGDFAVLISSGLTLTQALVLNLLSSLTAFIGGVVGILLGTNWNASPWIFAITGGLFVYISLVDMLPEVMRNPLLKTSPKSAFSLIVFGITLGFIIMFLIAGYEDQLLNALD